jgi:hypothetical protein
VKQGKPNTHSRGVAPQQFIHTPRHFNVNMTFSQHILGFFQSLQFPKILPEGIEVMNPYVDKETVAVCKSFYNKYYSDENKRRLIIGINPGRFGGGITGIPFTDPIRLKDVCGIETSWPRKQELSSIFVYDVIAAYQGAEKFYSDFYITAVSPLGFTRAGKNLNYYDDKQLQKDIEPFVIDCLQKQLQFGVHTDVAFCLGEGKNFAYLSKLNDHHHFFGEIVALPHPRFIMQYKLKRKEEYVKFYLEKLGR